MNRTKKKKRGGAAALDDTVYDIVIIAGQSNAVGYGIRNVCDKSTFAGCGGKIDLRTNTTVQGPIRISGYEIIDTTKVKMFTSSYDFPDSYIELNKNKIVDMSEPLNHILSRDPAGDSNKISFVSSFAKEYLKITEFRTSARKLLIVGCAKSATGMNEWIQTSDPYELYNLTIQRLQSVRDLLSSTNNSKVVAFLWHQGESDMTSTFNSAAIRAAVGDAAKSRLINTNRNNYKSKLKNSLTGMRTAIMSIFNNNNGGYTYPILLGGLSYDKQFNRITGVRNPAEFRQEMSKLISEVSNPNDPNYIPKSAFVSSDYFTFSPRLEGNSIMNESGTEVDTYGDDGNHHFSASSMREFGRRYFYFYNIIKNQ